MVTIIHGGHRKGLCFNAAKKLEQILKEKNVDTKLYNLRDNEFGFCCGDQPCQNSGVCIYKDIITVEIIPTIVQSDVLVFFTPTYFNMPPAILKNFMDRCNLLLTIKDRNQLQFGTWISGQTNKDSIAGCYKGIAMFAEICDFKLLKAGKIIRVETDTTNTYLTQDDFNNIQKMANKICAIR